MFYEKSPPNDPFLTKTTSVSTYDFIYNYYDESVNWSTNNWLMNENNSEVGYKFRKQSGYKIYL